MWRDQPNIFRPRHAGSAFYLPPGNTSSSSSAGDRGGSVPSAPKEFSPPAVIRHVSQERQDPVEVATEPMREKLLVRYRVENERLRDQVKAHAIHEALLEHRLQELSARTTALHLREMRSKDNDAVVEGLRKQLEDREHEVRSLQLQLGEQAGRIAAFEAALARPLRGTAETTTARTAAVEGEEAALTSSTSRCTHELLCQALSSVGFLTRVFNAVEHCHATPHESLECPRPLQECTTRCLQAAMRGNQETAGEVLSRGYRTSCEELALALREEVLFCETAAVRMAARLLAERAPLVSAGESPRETKSPPAVAAATPTNEQQQQQEQQQQKPKENNQNCTVQQAQVVSAAPRATRRPAAPRPTTEDCEVQ
ncbi:hypothetical protein DQ04_08111010 [Trypanosoma grayi]|uniref:hypothetical protein n=1 Tax=Trypanosoma grayi TaxID=71804 RepID=UPI0004F4AFA5|nr:hypothetical protein DQ04_08111010 [Trypanosoma grayi]KEG08059.1 hypothetical protein DQ04_08111010 [Trypanosoma grayi]